MCLSGTHFVEMLEANSSAWLGRVLLGDHDHPGAPLHGSSDGNFGQDSHLHVIVQLLLDGFLPVKGDGKWFVESHRLGVLVCKKFHWRRSLHEREGLLLTTVERRVFVPVQDKLFEPRNVFLDWREWNFLWRVWSVPSLGTFAAVRIVTVH